MKTLIQIAILLVLLGVFTYVYYAIIAKFNEEEESGEEV